MVLTIAGDKLCADYPSLTHGQLTYETSGSILEGSSVEFTCNSGYSLTGPVKKTCQEDSSWLPKDMVSCTVETSQGGGQS